MKNKLILKTPASWWGAKWREALPTGNGTIGATVYGAVHDETVLLTHEDLWLAIDDTTSNDKEDPETKSRRGLISMESKLNGNPFTTYLHRFDAKGRGRINFDLSSQSVSRSYSAWDVVEGELEFIMPPKRPELYWGNDREFAGRLKVYGANAWQAVADEFEHNNQLAVTMHTGSRERSYPVEIQSADSGAVLADFTVERGGIGHVPILLKGVPPGSALRAERHLNGKWHPLESMDHDEHSYYQGVLNADGSLDCAFNIARPLNDLSQSWRIRIMQSGE